MFCLRFPVVFDGMIICLQFNVTPHMVPGNCSAQDDLSPATVGSKGPLGNSTNHANLINATNTFIKPDKFIKTLPAF